MNKIKAGWAEADITPEDKVEICGQYYQRLPRRIHLRLGGSVLVLESDKSEQAVMISVDLTILPAVIKAWDSKSYSCFANSFDFAAVGHCRRAVYTNGISEMYGDTSRDDFIGMEGNEDSTVEILFTFSEDKKPTGAVVNVACPSQVMEATYFISSDFMGEVRMLLKGKFGQDFCTLCQISSAGDQSPRDLARIRDGVNKMYTV